MAQLCLLPNHAPPTARSLYPCTLPSRTQQLLRIVSFTTEKVEKILSTLDFDSATGLDGISSHMLKTCSAAIALPLSALFTLQFAQGHLLSAWKLASITALHKKVQKTIPYHNTSQH